MSTPNKVITGLKCCVHRLDCWDCCPYHPVDVSEACGKQQLLADALALLEPQLIPLDALQQTLRTPVWFETKNGKIYTGWALAYDIQKGMGITGTRMGITDPSGRVHWLRLEDYGITWRCWTQQPSEKERKEAHWNDGHKQHDYSNDS